MADFKTDPRIVLELARDRLRYQLSFYETIDSKVATLLVAASAILALLVSVLAIREEDIGRGMAVALIVAGVAYLLVFVAAAYTHWPREWYFGPELDPVYRDIQRLTETDIIKSLIGDFADCFAQNYSKRRGWLKPWALRLAGTALLAETAAVAAGLAVLVV